MDRAVVVLFVAGLFLPPLLLGVPFVLGSSFPMAQELVFPMWQQVLLFTTAFIVKPLYMTLSLVIVFLLRRHNGEEVVLIRRGLLLFFGGEMACAVNYLLFRDTSPLIEYWHNYGMVCAFTLFVLALMVLVDDRVIRYSNYEKHCAMLSLCGGCYKQREMRCTLLTLFLCMLIPLAAVAAMPLSASVENRFVTGNILGERVAFGHNLFSQIMEVRLFPWMATVFLLSAFILLAVRHERGFVAARLLVSVGIGSLLFSLMRFALYWGYAENPLWADVWEELTEFMFVLIVLKITLMVRSHQRRCHEISPAG